MSKIQGHHVLIERVQHKLEGITHPEIWDVGDYLEMRASRIRWYTYCTPQKKNEENASRGQ